MQTNMKGSIHTQLRQQQYRKTIITVCVTHFPTASQSLADEYALGLFCSGSVAVPVPVADPELVAASPSEPDRAVCKKVRREEKGRAERRRKENKISKIKTEVTRKKKERKQINTDTHTHSL